METKSTLENGSEIRRESGNDQSRSRRPAGYGALWALVVLLLIFNLVLAWSLLAARRQVKEALLQAGVILAEAQDGSIEYLAEIDQTIKISVDIPLDYLVEVPVNMDIPINTTVSIPIFGANGPTIDVPILANVPIHTTIQVPIRMSVPVKTDMPIKMDFPVSISIADTFLATSLEEIQSLLDQFSPDQGLIP